MDYQLTDNEEFYPTKIDWFKSKTVDEWQKYFMSRMPFTEQDTIDLEDYTVWLVGHGIIDDDDDDEDSTSTTK
jgi:hypothetical protein